MNLKCEEVLRKQSPSSLTHFALAAWINGRVDWNPELGLHLCKVSKKINDIVMDCDTKTKYGNMLYTYNNLKEIIEWEKKRHGQIQSKRHYNQGWLSKSVTPRAMVTVKLQDEIEMDEYPHKKVCRRLFTD